MIELLLSGFIGVLLGMIVMGIIVLKDHDEEFERTYNLGKRHGMELIMIRKAADKEIWELVRGEASVDA